MPVETPNRINTIKYMNRIIQKIDTILAVTGVHSAPLADVFMRLSVAYAKQAGRDRRDFERLMAARWEEQSKAVVPEDVEAIIK